MSQIAKKKFLRAMLLGGLSVNLNHLKTRLIFHLSYPKGTDESVNAGIPYEYCKVSYPDFQDAVLMCIEAGKSCAIAKSDMSMAFRNVPLMKKFWRFLCLKAQHPATGKWYYFFDKCLPFGSSISCKIFQDISNAIAHIIKYKTGKKNLNYLDDYFFVHLLKALCDSQVEQFLWVCNEINFPVSLEKTVWGTTILIFLGLLIDTVEQVIRIPKEKIEKAMDMIDYCLQKTGGKVTVLEIQKLCGTLNFLCKCIVPGRVFLHRLYNLTSTKDHVPLKQHYHIRLTKENRQDLMVWKRFLSHPTVFCRPFLDMSMTMAEDIDMFSDASGKIGFGAYCGNNWSFGFWSQDFLNSEKPSIDYLELYGLTVGVLLWIKKFKHRSVCLYCDNESVKSMVNKTTGTCKNSMMLLRLIVLECLVHNVKISVQFVRSEHNGKADAISRGQWGRFRKLGPSMNRKPEEVPECI